MSILNIDTRQFEELSRRLSALPPREAKQVLSRALARSEKKVERGYAVLASKRMRIPQYLIRERTKVRHADASVSLFVSSRQISLAKIGAKQTAAGVVVPSRGTYEKAFIATMKNGHRGVFRRPDNGRGRVARFPIEELYGPNPAGELGRNKATYLDNLRDVFDQEFMKQIEQGVSGMLKKIAAQAR